MVAQLVMVAAAAFNLMCSGSEASGSSDANGVLKTTTTKFIEVFRIDLASGRWCADECKTSKPVVAVSSDKLVLDQNDGQPGFMSLISINRESGELVEVLKVGAFVSSKSGTCEKSDFTGLPTKKF